MSPIFNFSSLTQVLREKTKTTQIMLQQMKRQLDNDNDVFEPHPKKRRTEIQKRQSRSASCNINHNTNDSTTWDLMQEDFDIDSDIDSDQNDKESDSVICAKDVGYHSDVGEYPIDTHKDFFPPPHVIVIKLNNRNKKRFLISNLIRLSWFKQRQKLLAQYNFLCINDNNNDNNKNVKNSIKWKLDDLKNLIKSAEMKCVYLPDNRRGDMKSLESLIAYDELFNKNKIKYKRKSNALTVDAVENTDKNTYGMYSLRILEKATKTFEDKKDKMFQRKLDSITRTDLIEKYNKQQQLKRAKKQQKSLYEKLISVFSDSINILKKLSILF